MRPGTGDVLDLWERLRGRGALDRAVALVALFEARAPDEIESWPVGRRDAAALAARARLLGDEIRATTPCPRCGTVAEMSFTAADVTAPPAASETVLRLDGRDVRLRAITSRDLRLALAAPDPRRALVEACVSDAGADGLDLAAVAAGLQALDPQADVELGLACVGCGMEWSAPFDVIAFVWTELAAWARRRLHEVHLLASAYGWSERDILALSPARRDAYLALCAA